jgi:hypothetical protein
MMVVLDLVRARESEAAILQRAVGELVPDPNRVPGPLELESLIERLDFLAEQCLAAPTAVTRRWR